MHDPIEPGRRAATRAVAVQAAVALFVAAGFLVLGPRQALAAAAGGVAMLLANALNLALALGGGIQPARAAYARLLVGTLGKWLVAMVVVAIALASWQLPPLPLLAGLVAGMVAYLLALNLGAGQRR